MLFSESDLRELVDQAEIDQPIWNGNYSGLAALARKKLETLRPNGSISENPMVRYLELREAMTAVHDPIHRHLPVKWRITWYEMLAKAIPEDEVELFCALLFASSLMSVVRYWYSIDAVWTLFPPYWDQWTAEIQGNPLFQGEYAKAQDCDVRFSSQLESCIRPVWGILSSAHSVITPHSLPTWVLDLHFTGEGYQPGYRFWSDEYSKLFQKGVEIILKECEFELQEMQEEDLAKGDSLLNLCRLEASRRYNIKI